MVLESFTQSVTNAITDPLTYVIIASLFAVPIYAFMKGFNIHRAYAFVFSLMLPVALLEFIFRFMFGYFGIELDYGSYTISIPYLAATSITDGVMFFKALDFIFNFGIFREFGLPFLTTFTETIKYLPEPSTQFKLFVAIYVSADSIVEYIFFYYFFFALIILASDLFRSDPEGKKLYAAAFASLPVIAYMVFVSNPIEEYETAMPYLQQVFLFIDKGNQTDVIIFIAMLLLSFLLVMEFLASAVSFFYGIGASTLKPSWQLKEFELSTQGIGFMYTLSFAIMYALHSFSWYVFFPALVLYSLFKKVAGKAVSVAQKHQEKQEMRDFIAGAQGGAGMRQKETAQEEKGGSGAVWLIVTLVGLAVLVYMVLARAGLV